MVPDRFRLSYLGRLHNRRQFLSPNAPAPPRPKGRPNFTSKDGGLLPNGAMDCHLRLLRLGPWTFL